MKRKPETSATFHGFHALRLLPEKIEGERRNDDEDGKLGWYQVSDRVEDRAELRLRRKERQDENLADGEDHVNRGGRGCSPLVARSLRKNRKGKR